MPGAKMEIDAAVVVNLLKSLFLAGLFNVLERIMRILSRNNA